MTAAVQFLRDQPAAFAAAYFSVMALSALWGTRLFRSADGTRGAGRLCRALLPAAGATLAFLFFHKIGTAYFSAANWLRLERPFFLVNGLSPYALPGHGPAAIGIYPPVSSWLLMPVTALRSLTAIAESAECLTLAVIVLPAVLWHLFPEKNGAADPRRAAALFAFLFFPFTTAALRNAFFNVHPDAAALGFGTLAAFFLSRERRDGPWLYLSSLAAVLAAWSKQPALTLLWALPLYLVWSRRTRELPRYLAYLVLNFAAIAGVFIACYGAEELAYFLLEVPARHPWIEGGGFSALAVAAERLVRASAEIAVLFAAALWLSRNKQGPGERPESGGRASAATLALWLAVCYLPAALIGRAKLGGSVNTLSYFSFYLLLSATLRLAVSPAERARALLAGLLFCLVIGHGVSLVNKFTLAKPDAPFAGTAFHAIRAHPGSVYFPRLITLHLIAEGRAYHGSVGLTDLLWAGRPLSESELRAYWPARPERVAFVAADADDMHWLGLPGSYRRVSDPELPGFIVYKRAA